MKDGRLCAAPTNARLRRRCAARKGKLFEDLRLCRGSSSYKSPSTKRGTPASQAPQEFQTSIFFFLQLFYYHQLPKLGVLLYGFPQFQQKLQLRENGNSSSKNRCVPEPLRFCAGGSFFRCGNVVSFLLPQAFASAASAWSVRQRTTRTLLKKRKFGRGNTYNNYYGVSFLPTHWK